MNRFTRWLVVGVFAAGALASCTDETEKNGMLVEPEFSEVGSYICLTGEAGCAIETTINGAHLGAFGSLYATGSGRYHSFVRLSDANDILEEGYNSTGRPLMPSVNTSPTFTKDLPLNRVPMVPCGGWTTEEFCREFDADINQTAGHPSSYLDLLSVRLFLSPTAGLFEGTDPSHPNAADPSSSTFGQTDGTFLVWDMDGVGDVYVRFDYDRNSSGSGDGDIVLLIPVSNFTEEANNACQYNGPEGTPGTTDCSWYVYLYSAFGTWEDATAGGDNTDGGEEWNTREAGFVTVTKTAETSFTRMHSWDVVKTADPVEITQYSGETTDAAFSVQVVYGDYVDSEWSVSGDIVIENPSDEDVEISTVTDEIIDVGPATVTCPVTLPYTLASKATLTCTYTRGLPDGVDRVNHAEVQLTEGGLNSGEAEVIFGDPTNELYESACVVDDQFTAPDDLLGCVDAGEEPVFTYTIPYTCDDDVGNHHNIATITPNDDGEPSDDFADVNVICLRKPLEVTKTAAGTYDRTVEWELTKSVDPASHTGFAGQDAGTSTWTVVATKTETSDNYQVAGSIFITNPGLVAQSFTVSDVLNDAAATTATVTCPSYTVDPGATVECTYTASPGDATATLNTATVSAEGNPDVPATAPIEWTENLIGYDSGTLSDARFGYEEVISASTTVEFPETFACSGNAADYTNGSYSYTETNEAILDSNIGLSDSKTVEVTCTLDPLVPSKTAAGTYDRTVEWTLEKLVDPESHTGLAGGVAGSSTWTVVATKTETLDNYQVAGEITISNPAPFARDFTVSDALDDGTPATVDCPSYTVPAGGSVVCTYGASPGNDDATLNTVTVSSPGNPDQTATATVGWTENLIGDDEVTLSDPRFDYEEIISGTTAVDFPETFDCSGDASLYEDGSYSYSEENWAYLHDGFDLSTSATVTVACTLEPLVPSKTAAGTYDRTVEWTLTKSVDPGSHEGLAGEVAGTSNWTVVATKTETLDNYQVAGDISIHNPAGIAQSFTVADVLDGTSATVTCPATGDNTGTVPAGGDVVCSYTASTDNDEATENTATVSATKRPPPPSSLQNT